MADEDWDDCAIVMASNSDWMTEVSGVREVLDKTDVWIIVDSVDASTA